MAKARRSPWMNERTSLLLARLGEYEMTLPEDIARQLISDHLSVAMKKYPLVAKWRYPLVAG